jgi:hypothetical protein
MNVQPKVDKVIGAINATIAANVPTVDSDWEAAVRETILVMEGVEKDLSTSISILKETLVRA